MTEQSVTPSDSNGPLAELRLRIRRLHRQSGEPSTRKIERQIGVGVISHTTVHGTLRCKEIPRWGPLELVVEALGGDVDEFRRLWVAARDVEDPPETSTPASVVDVPSARNDAGSDRGDQNSVSSCEFDLVIDTLRNGAVVTGEDLPLRVEGRYSGDPRPVRVILEDSEGKFYVQNPPIRFQPDGTWRAMNVLPGHGIVFVLLVELDEEGKNTFDLMVNRRDFGAFYELPQGSRVLRSIEITRV